MPLKTRHMWPKDLSSHMFGRLTAISATDKKAKDQSRLWECRCECGTVLLVKRNSLIRNNTRSCGCLARELNIQKCLRRTIHGHGRRIGDSPTYRSWRGMVERCSRRQQNLNNSRSLRLMNLDGDPISLGEIADYLAIHTSAFYKLFRPVLRA